MAKVILRLNANDVMRPGDIVHYHEGKPMHITKGCGWDGGKVNEMASWPHLIKEVLREEISIIKGGTMKETTKKYPKRVYVQFRCPTNSDLALDAFYKITNATKDEICAVYELKELVKVEMVPKITKVK